MKKTIGILAHVDAGKTTFSESVLYLTGAIRKKGRVDHQDTFLDNDPLEMARGITIFSGQAHFTAQNDDVYWLDTPGHADFSSEMARSVSVMDYAVLLISASDGVQSHTEKVWQILLEQHVPVFVFINKCDRNDVDPDAVIKEMKQRLSEDILDLRHFRERLTDDAALTEQLAGYDETLMEHYFRGDTDEALWDSSLTSLIRSRSVFPVMCGSALTGEGVEGFLHFVLRHTPTNYSPAGELRALCYRVRHEDGGKRFCFLKLLSGTLTVKAPIGNLQEKVNEIRIYSGLKYQRVNEAHAGDLIAVPLTQMRIGDTIGDASPMRSPFRAMTSAALLYDQVPASRMLEIMRMLEDEDPCLGVRNDGDAISVQVIGPMQLEILAQQILDRFGISVSFGPPRILYHETVSAPVIGIGHYEPLRHYAEVHLRLSPAPRGSGIHFRSYAHVDDLSLNWQRLIATHVYEKEHKGVLTGSPLTDVYIDLLCGRDHLKHTEGGDFRQATYRAIRNALMYADSVLLEPVCRFEIRIPSDQWGTLAGELSRLQADCEPVEYMQSACRVRGTAVYARFLPFQDVFPRLTHGLGTLQVFLDHEVSCHNTQEVIQQKHYNPLADDTPDSVFCSHGAGFTVAWDHVRDFAHLETPASDVLKETKLD